MSSALKAQQFSDVQEYSTDLESGLIQKQDSFVNEELNTQKTVEYDDDHPAPLSLNPVDWIRDIKHEIKTFSWQMSERRRILMRAIAGEGLCTFLFLFIVEAVAINNSRQVVTENLTLGAIATAFTSVALIYSFADVSGAHFNPAVTFATIVTGKVSLRKGFGYIGAQLLASILATAYLMVVFPKPVDQGFKSIPAAVVISKDISANYINAFFMEFTLSFILVYVIFATAFDTVDTNNKVKVDADIDPNSKTQNKKDEGAGRKLTIYTTSGNSKAGFAPLAIGFTLGFLCFIGGSVSGGAFNPARVFGPAIITNSWNNHWIYWVADLSGAAIAGWTQSLFAHKAVQSSSNISTNKAKH